MQDIEGKGHFTHSKSVRMLLLSKAVEKSAQLDEGLSGWLVFLPSPLIGSLIQVIVPVPVPGLGFDSPDSSSSVASSERHVTIPGGIEGRYGKKGGDIL